jgi:hypothetical protein
MLTLLSQVKPCAGKVLNHLAEQKRYLPILNREWERQMLESLLKNLDLILNSGEKLSALFRVNPRL